MAERFIELNNGKLGTNEALTTSAGAGDAGKIIGLNSSGKIDITMMPTGVGADVQSIVVEDASGLAAGDYVNIFDSAGTPKVRLADNSNGRAAHGFVKAAFADAATAVVYFEAENSDLSGLTAGNRVYLGTAGGVITTPLDPAVDTGSIHQFLGVALSATEVNTDIDDCIQL